MYSIRDNSMKTLLRKSTRCRWTAALAVMGGLLFTAGCANIHDNPPMTLRDRTEQPDEAMRVRNWPATVVTYANGSVLAPPTGFPYYAKPTTTGWLSPFVDFGLFVGQTVALPVTMCVVENPQVYSGVVVPQTDLAAPPVETVP